MQVPNFCFFPNLKICQGRPSACKPRNNPTFVTVIVFNGHLALHACACFLSSIKFTHPFWISESIVVLEMYATIVTPHWTQLWDSKFAVNLLQHTTPPLHENPYGSLYQLAAPLRVNVPEHLAKSRKIDRTLQRQVNIYVAQK